MNSNLKWKAAFIVFVVLLGIYGLIGRPIFPTSLTQVKQNFVGSIKLGLDLQGGTHLIIQVKVDEAVQAYTDQTIDRLRNVLRERNLSVGEVRLVDRTHILARDIAPDAVNAFRDLISSAFADFEVSPAPGEASGYVLTLRPSAVANIHAETMRQAVETIRRRIDQLGLTEPVISEHGGGQDEILIQLPGEGDPNRAKAVIRAGGQLELKLVRGGPYGTRGEALTQFSGILPVGTELLPAKPESLPGGQLPLEMWYLVERVSIVTGRDVRNASYVRSTQHPGFYDVVFNLNNDGARRFDAATGANIGKPLAIVLDGRVETAPTIQGRISDSGNITGRFTLESARDLALILRSGALPASIVYLEERTIGPSLGADSIRQGFLASMISLVLVIIFMVVYYRFSGINAAVALIMNLMLLLAILAYAGAVLTLPGIAGVLLTVGMGVDSNVLIFERIREELRAGKAPASAVELGFNRAFLTIIDTHVTTVVSALFLMMFGTGPVRGFAITLVIGLVANLFTAVYVSRTIFDWHLSRMSRQAELSI